MDEQSLMRKSVHYTLFLILLSLASCSPPCHQWKLASIKAHCPAANYVKVYLPACNTFNGLEAEFMCSNGDMQLYLNSLTLQLPCDPCDPDHVNVNVTIGDDTFTYVADRLLGGQRLVMPEDAREQIICALLEGNDVDISIGRYETTLISQSFAKNYDQLVSISYP